MQPSASSSPDSARAGVHSYEPARGHGLKHDPLNAIVGPRPIGWISTRSREGINNLAPYSFFNLFSYVPPIIGFSSVGFKDSARNCGETKTFAWNLATLDLAQAMNLSSATLPPQEDEFVHAGLTPEPSALIDAPRVRESPVTFECVVTQQFRLLNRDGEASMATMTFGEVVMIHIAEHLIVEGVFDSRNAGAILRSGRGGDYVAVRPDAFFEMPRPQ